MAIKRLVSIGLGSFAIVLGIVTAPGAGRSSLLAVFAIVLFAIGIRSLTMASNTGHVVESEPFALKAAALIVSFVLLLSLLGIFVFMHRGASTMATISAEAFT